MMILTKECEGLFKQYAVYETIIDRILREANYDKEAAEEEWPDRLFFEKSYA